MKEFIKSNAILLLTMFVGNTVNAQIKVVGDNYADSLTATKNYYEQDVNFDRFFPSTTPQKEFGRMDVTLGDFGESGYDLNLTGDTLYLFKDINEFYGASFVVAGDVSVSCSMPKGYYVIDGYVFCIDNVNELRKQYGLESLRTLGPNDHSGEWTSIKRLKDKILKDEIESHWDLLPFLRYMILKPVGATQDEREKTFYLLVSTVDGQGVHCNTSDISDFIPLRFYNEVRKFVGKEVVWIDGMVDYTWGSEGTKPRTGTQIPNCFELENKILEDGITKDLVKLQDTRFICKDVVLKEGAFFAILSGNNTGSFAVELNRIIFAYDSKDVGTRGEFYRIEKKIKNRDIPCLMTYYPCGYIIESKHIPVLAKREKMAQLQREKEEQQKKSNIRREQEQRKSAFVQQMTSKHGEKYGELIGKHQIAIDMTKEMCRDAWGKPMNTYRTTTKYGQSEVWCYNYKTKVYFYNGKVVQIDD